MNLLIQTKTPETILESIKEAVNSELTIIHKKLHKQNEFGNLKDEAARKWNYKKDYFYFDSGQDSDEELKLFFEIGKGFIKFSFQHEGDFENEDYELFFEDLLVFILRFHNHEISSIKIDFNNFDGDYK